ncbi:aminotransferase class V-fold PLP-dependent enzyme [Defluviimonas sp. WL0050]|uniref:Aminotransferase class V-fold PLP-dependent enzyme n=1 Tax=Albidovulum litorale TaxID=2984134 RepID=A0ABT2ZQ43_9RHOB|nr:aminotransferase class V-fold PLP-dependent enzyme [Defluviimonas sp. WL0050]MCV2872866.1 aminotransferase class V-fold PLP-dependent enzyme [Defluviimonas sp. WL0050]
MQLDLGFVRASFPAFAVPDLANRAFFENAGGSYASQPVIDRLTRFYRERKVQPYGPYAASSEGGAEMDEARLRLAAMMGVKTHEVSFGPSTTQNTYVLAQAFRRDLKPGEAIVVTDQDHEANSGPWRRLGEEGIEIREWKIDPTTGHLDPARLAPLLADGRVRLVCFPHCSNVVAEINPVAEIVAMAHDAGAATCVDGVSYAPHGLPNVAEIGADIYLFSAYKVYGPHQGIMVIREDLGMRLPNQGHYFNGDMLYKRFTPAGPDHAQVAASAGIADYFDALHAHHFGPEPDAARRAAQVHDLMRAHEVAVCQPLLDYLGARNDLRLIGPRDATRRAPTVAVALDREAEPVSAALADHGINCWAGDFYAVRPLTAMGVDLDRGVLRLSMVHYTSAGDVTRLITALDKVL